MRKQHLQICYIIKMVTIPVQFQNDRGSTLVEKRWPRARRIGGKRVQ